MSKGEVDAAVRTLLDRRLPWATRKKLKRSLDKANVVPRHCRHHPELYEAFIDCVRDSRPRGVRSRPIFRR